MFTSIRRHWDILTEAWAADRAARKGRARPEETAFLPAALEILQTPPNPLGRMMLWVILSFLTLALLWACLGHIDVVATAEGKVIPKGRVKVIQSADQGVVRAIHVREGDLVTKGQPLMVLDPTVSGAEVEQARQALLSARIDVARARALVDHAQGRAPIFRAPDGAPTDTVVTQRSFVEAKVAEHSRAIAALDQERQQRIGDLGMVESEIAKLTQQLPMAEEQLKGMQELGRQGYAGSMRVSETEQRTVGMRQDLAIRRDERLKAQAAIRAVTDQMEKQRNEFAAARPVRSRVLS